MKWYSWCLLIIIVVGGIYLVGQFWPTEPSIEKAIVLDQRQDFAPLTPIMIGQRSMQASVADSPEERATGLSYTVSLPEDVVKLFIFDTSERWSFWMKDMNYPIDIMWLSETGEVVDIASNLSPDTYPQAFLPAVSARYVIETNAGFLATEGIVVGTMIALPSK